MYIICVSMKIPCVLLILPLCSESTCLRVQLEDDLGVFNGVFSSTSQQDGSAQYFSSNGIYNLFVERIGNGCIWEIDNLNSEFPVASVMSFKCTHDSMFQDNDKTWKFIDKDGISEVNISIKCLCKEESPFKLLYIIIIIIVVFFSIFLLVLMHVNIRKRRILKATNECTVCKERKANLHKLSFTHLGE